MKERRYEVLDKRTSDKLITVVCIITDILMIWPASSWLEAISGGSDVELKAEFISIMMLVVSIIADLLTFGFLWGLINSFSVILTCWITYIILLVFGRKIHDKAIEKEFVLVYGMIPGMIFRLIWVIMHIRL